MVAHGPGRIAFSENHPGELITLPLEPGQTIHVRQQAQSLIQDKSAIRKSTCFWPRREM